MSPSARRHCLSATLLFSTACSLLLPSTDVDRELGEENSRLVDSSMGLVEDATIAPLVAEVGARLVGKIEPKTFDYRIAVVDETSANAFAVPGGWLYVSRGLLALAASEDELAGVLGHEIQHVERRHSVKQMGKQRRIGVLALPGKIVGAIVSDDLGKLLGSPFELVTASYSRGQEHEADTLGQALCAKAGYQPVALAAILDRMERFDSVASGSVRKSSFFDSHPSTPDRVAALTRDAKALVVDAASRVTADDGAFADRLDGLRIGDDPGNGVVRGTVFLHPVLDFHIALPPSWKVTNSRESVAAVAPNKDGVAVLGIAGKGGEADIAKLADARATELEREHGAKPERKSVTTSAGVQAQAVIVTDSSGADPVHVYFLWFALGGTIFETVGMSPESHRELIRAAVESVRPLTEEERASITDVRLRVVSTTEGETLRSVSERLHGAWTVEQAAVVNGVLPDAPLAAGRRIRVAVTVPYDESR